MKQEICASLDLDTFQMQVGEYKIDGDQVTEDHPIFEELTPFQVWELAKRFAYNKGFSEGVKLANS